MIFISFFWTISFVSFPISFFFFVLLLLFPITSSSDNDPSDNDREFLFLFAIDRHTAGHILITATTHGNNFTSTGFPPSLVPLSLLGFSGSSSCNQHPKKLKRREVLDQNNERRLICDGVVSSQTMELIGCLRVLFSFV